MESEKLRKDSGLILRTIVQLTTWLVHGLLSSQIAWVLVLIHRVEKEPSQNVQRQVFPSTICLGQTLIPYEHETTW